MKKYLKDINKDLIYDNVNNIYMDNHTYIISRNTLDKAIDILVKNKTCVETQNMSIYQNRDVNSCFTHKSDAEKEAQEYKNSTDKELFLLQWYFKPYILNEVSKIKRKYDK